MAPKDTHTIKEGEGVTIDELATMVKKGFDGLEKSLDGIRIEMATKKDISGICEEISELRGEMNERFESTERTLDRLAEKSERKVIKDHEHRIARVENELALAAI